MNSLEKLGFICIKNNDRKIIYKRKGYKTIEINKKKRKLYVKSRFIIIDTCFNLTPNEMIAVNELLEELNLYER